MNVKYYLSALFIVLFAFPSDCLCFNFNFFKKKKAKSPEMETIYIYKTRYNYSRLIPVILNDEKTEIVFMPTKECLLCGDGSYLYPEMLSGGYLMVKDIFLNPNSAFLNLTYEDYFDADYLPDAEEQIKYVRDFEPFTELYVYKCEKGKDPVEVVNGLIKSNKVRELKNLIH